jgi:hypothetical protein
LIRGIMTRSLWCVVSGALFRRPQRFGSILK